MNRYKLVQCMIIISCFAICLMGVSFAGYTDCISVLHNVTTAKMDYTSKFDGNMLNVELDGDESIKILNLLKDESYEILYSLGRKDRGNISLKKISHEYIGDITVNLTDFVQEGKVIETNDFMIQVMPKSLGTFQCYHDFDGIKGKITLKKISDPIVIEEKVNLSELPEEIQLQIEEGELVSNIKSDTEIEDEDVLLSLNIEAEYGFEIPLSYNQFNADIIKQSVEE